VRWIAWLLVTACSSSTGTPTHPAPPPPGEPIAAAPTSPTDAECEELITHAVALGIDEQSGHAEPHATASEHEAIRRSLHEEFMTGCRSLSRDAFRCAMAATTLTALAACQPAQRTPSSSTSNNSVAPGGITPPAPRSP
jgi:hypothetical protein